jgi:hypothetical protein
VVNLPRVREEGGFQINEPQPGWITEEMTLDVLLSKRYGASLDKSAYNSQSADARSGKRAILQVRSKSH